MPPRAYWKGALKISLVSFPVRLYNAVTEANRVHLNQVHKDCNSRLRFPPTCPVHGQVERSEIAKAYEFEPDQYVIIDQAELDKIKLRTEKTIELVRFVPADAVQDVYLDSAYFVAPDGPLADEPFRVFRQALRQTAMVGIGRVVLGARERWVVLRDEDKGFVLTTLHTAREVRAAEPYFEEIGAGKVDADHLRLAVDLIKSKTGKFEPQEFSDRYEEALLSLLKAKIEGSEPVVIQEEEAPTTFNFMEALRRSLGDAEETPAAASQPRKAAKAAKKPPAKSVPATKKARRKKQA